MAVRRSLTIGPEVSADSNLFTDLLNGDKVSDLHSNTARGGCEHDDSCSTNEASRKSSTTKNKNVEVLKIQAIQGLVVCLERKKIAKSIPLKQRSEVYVRKARISNTKNLLAPFRHGSRG